MNFLVVFNKKSIRKWRGEDPERPGSWPPEGLTVIYLIAIVCSDGVTRLQSGSCNGVLIVLWTCLGWSLAFGPVLERSQSLLGRSWAVLGASWGPLGSLLGPLEAVLGPFGGFLEPKLRQQFWQKFGRNSLLDGDGFLPNFCQFFCRYWAILGRSWALLGAS
jgi:hypothetical protein